MNELQEIQNPADQHRIASDSVPAHYLGAKVNVHYNLQSGLTDSGIIVFLNNHWIELSKDNGERLLIPIEAVRLVKLVKASVTHEEATSLLRPSLLPPPDKE